MNNLKKRRAKKHLPRPRSGSVFVERTKASGPDGISESVTPLPGFPIVGIGASAGGLEAFRDLLRKLPSNTGMAFVLVQHLDPEHSSSLAEILSSITAMPVQAAAQKVRVAPNQVYVIPPNARMTIEAGRLKLTPRRVGPPHSVDLFFESLAEAHGERAIGVVLSGNATDGTLGLEAIKAAGGVTFAQDDSAKNTSMPRSAVAAGCVDFVMAPGRIAAELARIARHPFVRGQPLASGGKGTPRTGPHRAKAETAGPDEVSHGDFQKILSLLHAHSGVDFSLYKSATIRRRILRRAVVNRHATIDAYAAFLKGNEKELEALYSDVLICVTSFFRNPDAFDLLRRKIFPRLLKARGRNEPLRIWVLGCSTGQEAYSLAMAHAEAAAAADSPVELQIFATDLNEALLEKARAGLYARTVLQGISPERLKRFFVEENGGFRISKTLRDRVIFARQNVVTDPPFSHLDLISCRNLLIYLESDLQKRLIANFHYALKPEGVLFLGASESVGEYTDLFSPLDKKHKIFVRKNVSSPYRLPMPASHPTVARPIRQSLRPSASPRGLRGELDAQREADRLSVARFAPPSVLVSENGQILQFRGTTETYLRPATGKASFDLLKMARDGLLLPLRAALAKAQRDNRAVRREEIHIRNGRGSIRLAIEVIPVRNPKERNFLVLFDERPGIRPRPPRPLAVGADAFPPSPPRRAGAGTDRIPGLPPGHAREERQRL